MEARLIQKLWRILVFLWMGDQLAAFFALPPSQLRVGAPRTAQAPTIRNDVAPGEDKQVHRLVSSLQSLSVGDSRAGVHEGRAAGTTGALLNRARGRGRGCDSTVGKGMFATRSQANKWIHCAASAGSYANDETSPADAICTVLSDDKNEGETMNTGSRPPRFLQQGAARGGRRGGSALPGKAGNGTNAAAKNQPPSKTKDAELLWDGKNAGSLPNMLWRAVSMEDLRQHPHFVGLPEPHEVKIQSAIDYRKFRQGSKQWCLLHDGRLTTSRLAPILGIYEPTAQSKLAVPRSLSGHHKVMEAYFHLIRAPCDEASLHALQAQEELWPDNLPPAEAGRPTTQGAGGAWASTAATAATSLYVQEPMTRGQRRRARGKEKTQKDRGLDSPANPASHQQQPPQSGAHVRDVWVPAGAAGRFGFEYKPASSAAPPAWRVESSGHARMIWGNTQEPTSMLAAVNQFNSVAGAVVHEVGVCPLEAVEAGLDVSGLPLIGASPDCYLRYPNGSIEALEVKNHAPFRAGGTTWKSSRRGAFAFSDGGPFDHVATWHVPQVQLEMLCLGPNCRATNFLSCSATKGINIMRVLRDDKYIARMLQYARIFHSTFTMKKQVPPDNFAADLYPDYDAFLQDTKRISDSAEMIAHIKPHDVQRSPYNRRLFLDL